MTGSLILQQRCVELLHRHEERALDEYLPVLASVFHVYRTNVIFSELGLGESQIRLLMLLCCLGRYLRAVKASPASAQRQSNTPTHRLDIHTLRVPRVCLLLSSRRR